jgi:hypothetical protein
MCLSSQKLSKGLLNNVEEREIKPAVTPVLGEENTVNHFIQSFPTMTLFYLNQVILCCE